MKKHYSFLALGILAVTSAAHADGGLYQNGFMSVSSSALSYGLTLPSNGYYQTSLQVAETLKVALTAPAFFPISGTGVTPGLNCAAFEVTARTQPPLGLSASKTLRALILRPGYQPTGPADPCYSAQATANLNFTSIIAPNAQFQGELAYQGAVSILVSQPETDNCRLNGQIYVGGCPINNLYSTHNIGVKLNVTSDRMPASNVQIMSVPKLLLRTP